MEERMERLRERVVAGLSQCATEPEWDGECDGCPYRDAEEDFCISRLCRDALEIITGEPWKGAGPDDR